jgi:hypothetical protein
MLLHNSSVEKPPPRLILLFNSILSSVAHCRTNSSHFSRSHLFRDIYSKKKKKKNEMHNVRRRAHRRGRRRDHRHGRRRGRSVI